MSEPIITVEGRGKRYRLGAGGSGERYTALRDVISENVKDVFKKLKRGKAEKLKNGRATSDVSISDSQDVSVSRAEAREEFWALKDVSFVAKQGEVLASGSEGHTARRGIIGGNGASRASDRGSLLAAKKRRS